MSRAAVVPLLALLSLSGCGFGLSGGASSQVVVPAGPVGASDLDRQIACRERVNEMYEQRGRTDIYAPAAAVNTPYSAGYQSGITSRGLASQYDYDRSLSGCERNTGAGNTAPTPPPSPAEIRGH